jgi:hypothetical protein
MILVTELNISERKVLLEIRIDTQTTSFQVTVRTSNSNLGSKSSSPSLAWKNEND